MEKKVNGTWLFLVLLVALLALVFVLTYVDQSADSYSGGMLVECPDGKSVQCAAVLGGADE